LVIDLPDLALISTVTLTDDQRALLRLLAQREEGYEDIAALKGLSVEQVRAEVKEALAEMQAAGETPPPLPPPPPAKVEEPAAEPTPIPEMKEPPESPPPPSSPPAVELKAQAKEPASRASRPALPAERRRLVLLTGGALAIVAVVLAAIAIFSGGSDSSSSPSEASGAATETTAAESGKLTQAVLEPADGSDASGQAIFGRLKKEIVLQVTGEGLQPTEEGQSYIVWLYRSPKLSLRLGSVGVDESGRLGARFPIPAELLAYVAGGAFDQIYVSRTEDAAYQAEVTRAKKSKSLPRYTGETVLTGEITGPIAKGEDEGASEGG
jgi:hypothetical protein